MVYHFVILTDDDKIKDFRREIDIDAEATFQELNDIILKTCGYNKNIMTSFFVCDEYWDKLFEITAMDMNDDPKAQPKPLMSETHIGDMITEEEAKKEAKLMFEFDIMCERYLYIQIMSVREHEHMLTPKVTLEKGQAPKQEMDIEDMFKEAGDNWDDDLYNEDELDMDGYQDLEDMESGDFR